MALMNSKIPAIFDAETKMEFNGTATADTVKVPLNPLVKAYWDNGEQPNGDLVVHVAVDQADFTTGDETYGADVKVCNADGTGGVTIGAPLTFTKAGYARVVLPVSEIQAALPTAALIYLNVKLAGTTPSCKLHAWLDFGGVK